MRRAMQRRRLLTRRRTSLAVRCTQTTGRCWYVGFSERLMMGFPAPNGTFSGGRKRDTRNPIQIRKTLFTSGQTFSERCRDKYCGHYTCVLQEEHYVKYTGYVIELCNVKYRGYVIKLYLLDRPISCSRCSCFDRLYM